MVDLLTKGLSVFELVACRGFFSHCRDVAAFSGLGLLVDMLTFFPLLI